MTNCSVIIPTYNRSRTIARALASALTQTVPPHEVIVVDDASNDDTATAVAAFSDRRIRLIRHDRRLGAAAARNTGARAARGRWLAFLDSDDEWVPQKLARQLAVVGTPPHSGASVTGYVIIDNRNGNETKFQPPPTITVDDMTYGCSYSPGSTLMVSADTFAVVGEFDAALARLEDWDWLVRLAQREALIGVSEVLAKVHKSGNPVSRDITSSVTRLAEKHGAYFRRRSWRAGRTFRSTLLVERASSMHYEGKTLRSIGLTLRALASWPLRGKSFYALLARRVFGRVRLSY